MNKRYIGAFMLAPFVIFIFIGGPILKYAILVLSLMGLYEFYKVSKEKGIRPISIFTYLLSVIYFVSLNQKNISNPLYFKYTFLLLFFSVFLLLCVPVLNQNYNYLDVSVTLLGFLYIPVFFSFIVMVNMKQYGYFIVWLIFISAWICDTGAYYTGKFFGKRKLNPKVSPKKTVEGSIGGLLTSSLACGLFGCIINQFGVSIAIYHYFLIGLLSGTFCQFGDLVASAIKRYVGVKDYSNIIPGHGGILDRFDSILFASVIVYYYITIFLRM